MDSPFTQAPPLTHEERLVRAVRAGVDEVFYRVESLQSELEDAGTRQTCQAVHDFLTGAGVRDLQLAATRLNTHVRDVIPGSHLEPELGLEDDEKED
jgi:hypothetical protein